MVHGTARAALLGPILAFGVSAASLAEEPPRLARAYYGRLAPTSAVLPDSEVSAWLGGQRLATTTAEPAGADVVYELVVPCEGASCSAVEFRIDGAAASGSGSPLAGDHSPVDLTATLGPDLSLTIDDGLPLAYPGAHLTYTLTVTNLGPQPAYSVVLRDPLPVATRLIVAGGAVLTDGAVVWPAFDLAAGASEARTVEIAVEGTFPEGMTTLVNTASARHDGSTGLDPLPANNVASDSDEFAAPADFAVTDADLTLQPASPNPGDTATARLLVRNTGVAAATGLVAFYDGRAGSGQVVGSVLVTLQPGASQTVSTSFVVGAATALIAAEVDPDDTVREISETNNSALHFLREAADPAVGIDNLALSPAAPTAGTLTDVAVTVRNGGRLPVSNLVVELWDGAPEDGGSLITSTSIASLPVGANRTVRAPWTAVEGYRRIVAIVDPADAVLELSETNNRAERLVDIRRANSPDLVVGTLDRTSLSQSSTTLVLDGTLRATIENQGSAAATAPFAVRLFLDRDGDGFLDAEETELARATVPAGLAPLGAVTVDLPAHATLPFFHPLLWVEVDPDNVIAEASEANNRKTCFADCETAATAGSLLPVTEQWYVPGLEVESTPVVVQLTDDNGDGRIDGLDVADIVFHTEDSVGRAVTARSGIDGRELWTFRNTTTLPVAGRLANLAAGDLDGDGVAEIIGAGQGRIFALDAKGTRLWTGDPIENVVVSEWAGSISLGDMDGDGVPEIAVGRTVLDHLGHKLAVGTSNAAQNTNYFGPFGVPVPPGIWHNHSTLADLDGDGRAELVAGDAVYRLSGNQLTVVWDYSVPDNLMRDGYAAVANLDGDAQPEIVYVSSGFVMVFNHDGTVAVPYRRTQNLSPVSEPTFWAGAPTIADLDGDGVPEILIAVHYELVAFRANLSVYWRRPTTEFSELTAATAFDLDGDGKAEVLGLDHTTFFIANGRTGQTLYSRPNTSKTACEAPVVADVDGDGRAEILVPSNRGFDGDSSTQGLHVLGNPTWRATRAVWNEYGYHGTNAQADGTVPSPEPPGWVSPNGYRVNVAGPLDTPRRRANLTVSAPRVGALGATGIPVTLRIGNGGLAPAPAGVVVELYAGEPSPSTLAGHAVTPVALPPGGYLDLAIVWQRAGGPGVTATAVVDVAGQVEECAEDDNRTSFTVDESVLPDLAIPPAGVTVPATPTAGQRLTLSVRVENHGPATAAASVLRLSDGPRGTGPGAASAPIPSLAPGAFVTVPIEWDTVGAAGQHVLYVEADADNLVIEPDEANNLELVAVSLVQPTKPDLAVETLTTTPAAVPAGTPVVLEAEVANRGSNLSTSWELSFRVNNAEVARRTIAGPLAQGARAAVQVTLDTLALSGHLQVEAKADPASAIPEQNETNNSRVGSLDVTGSGLKVAVTTDKVSYTSSQTAALTVTSTNTGTATRTATLRVEVRDGGGALVAQVSEQVLSLPAGAKVTNLTWTVGSTPAGPYSVVAELRDAGAVAARGTAGFAIAADRLATAQLFAGQSQYESDDTVALTGRVRNAGVNAPLLDLAAKSTIRSPAGATVYTGSLPISRLDPGAEAAVDTSWPVANAAPGIYTSSLELRETAPASPQLAYTETTFEVLSSAQTGKGLTGTLVTSPASLGAGATLLADVTTSNGGNADVPDLVLRLRLVRASDESEAWATELPWPLLRGATRSEQFGVPTRGLAEGEYIVRLEAVLPTRTRTLASSSVVLLRGVSVDDVAVAEGDSGSGIAVVAVSLSSPASESVTVHVTTADGSATAPSDYDALGVDVTFAPGEVRQEVSVSVHGDTVVEADETFLVTLANPLGVELGDAEAIATIRDEEGCASPNLLVNGDGEAPTIAAGAAGWTAASGSWRRGTAAPTPLAGSGSLALTGSSSGELTQEVSLAPYTDAIDRTGVSFVVSGYARATTGSSATARILVEYTSPNGANVFQTYDSGVVALGAGWQAFNDGRLLPVGTRRARVRLIGSTTAGAVAFDQLELRSLAIPTLSALDAERSEGDSGSAPLAFTAQISCAPAGGVTLQAVTAPDTATADSDYTTTSTPVTFLPGTLTASVEVPVIGDTTDETDEGFYLVWSGGVGSVVLTPRVRGTIRDDDGPVVASVADASAAEGDSGTTAVDLTISLSSPSGHEVRVSWTTADGAAPDGAAAPADYQTASGVAIFPPGTTVQPVSVRVVGDRLDEVDEVLRVRLSAPVQATLGDAEAELRILDDDEVGISVGDVRVVEGDGSVLQAAFAVTLSVASTRTVRVAYATADATALAPADYTATSGTLTFAPGTTVQTVNVPVVGELVKEPEETFFLRLTDPENASLVRPEGVGTIVDNDGVLVTVTDVTVRELDTNATATFQVKLSKAFNQPITVNYTTADGSALAGADYQAAAGVVTFPINNTLQNVTVTVLPDAIEEATESFALRLANPTNGALIGDGEGIGTIVDGDLWVLNGTASDTEIPGCVRLTPDTTGNTASAWRKARIDLSRHFDKTFTVFLGYHDGSDGVVFALQNQGFNALGLGGGYHGFIGIPTAVGVEVDTYANGWDPAFDHLGYQSATSETANFVTPVLASVANPDVEDGREHQLRVVWNATTKTMDAHFDGSERIFAPRDVVASDLGGASSVIYGVTGANGSLPNYQYFCEPDICRGSAALPQISTGDARIVEPDSGTLAMVFPVTLACPTDHPVTVNFATVDGTALAGSDFIAASGTLTFLPGETAKDVVVQAIGDNLGEADETFSVDLSGAAGGQLRYSHGTGAIVSDEVGIRIGDVTDVEGNSLVTIYVPVTLNQASAGTVTVNYATVNGTATAGVDYTAASGTLTFQTGETSKLISVQVRGDVTLEPDEAFSIRLSQPSGGELARDIGQITLLDDDDCLGPSLLRNGGGDEPMVGGQIPGWTVVAGTTWTNAAGCSPSLVGPCISAGFGQGLELRQDVDLGSFATAIDSGQQRFRFVGFLITENGTTVDDRARIAVEYLDVAGNKLATLLDTGELATPLVWRRFGVVAAAPSGARVARVRLLAKRAFKSHAFDEISFAPLGTPALSLGDVRVTEGNTGVVSTQVPVLLSCPARSAMVVSYLTQDGTATAPSDFHAAVGTLNLSVGATGSTIPVEIVGDTRVEGDETFSVRLSQVTHGGIADGDSIVTIAEDEVSLSVPDLTVVEGNSGTTAANFVVTLSAASDQLVTVDYVTEASTATAGDDFLPISGTLSFAPGETSKVIRVDVLGETVAEPDEKLKLTLSNPLNALLQRGQASGTILTDDYGLAISDVTVLEGVAGTSPAVFTVTLSAKASAAVTVRWASRAGSATAGIDYTEASGTLSFAAGETTKTITVSVKGDTAQEASETFFVELNTPVNAQIVDDQGLGVIADDDGCPGPNLLTNPGAEDAFVDAITGWTAVSGTTWAADGTRGAQSGTNVFFPGSSVSNAELRQDVDISAYSTFVDGGIQRFFFEGFVRSGNENPADLARISVQYLDAAKSLLSGFDSGDVASVTGWRSIADLRLAPPGTRWIRVRLLATRVTSGPNDAFFDGLSLRSLDTPVVLVADVDVDEGDTTNVTATFTAQLNCASSKPIAVDFATADGTAQAPLDYSALSGTWQFAPGEVTKSTGVTVVGDFRNEALETFSLQLAHPSNAVVFDPLAVARVRDLDPTTAPVAGRSRIYTLDGDFDLGSAVAVDHDVPNTDQLQVGTQGGSFTNLWVAASARGTIVKIDTRSGRVLGEYSTNPDGGTGNPDPSRTTVALDGSVWVGNRGDGSVLHVGLPELWQCIDRNHNGSIETSTGYGDVLAWTGTADLTGGVSQAKDECILHYVKVSPSIVRHVSVDRNNDIWVSGFQGANSGVFNQIDGDTGTILRTVGPFGCGGYGGFIDRNNVLWSATLFGSLLRWDLGVEPATAASRRCLAVSPYGIGIDSHGTVWASERDGAKVWKVSSDGNTILGPYTRGTSHAQGLALDGQDHAWVSPSYLSSETVVSHMLSDGQLLGMVSGVPAGATGVAVDQAGKIWTANLLGSSASRIDPALGPIGSDGLTPVGAVDLVVPLAATPGRPAAGPYNYSDMTGFVALRSTASFGRWFVIQDGGAAGTEWGMIRWNQEPQASVPAGSRIVVEVHAADNMPALSTAPWVAVTSGAPFAVAGRYLQVRVTLERNAAGQSPVLSDLEIQAAQDGELSVDDVSVVEGDAGNGDAAFTVKLATPVNRDVSVSYATADGTAAAPGDYAMTSGSLTLPYGTTTATVHVPIVGDTQPENDETFSLRLSSPVHGSLTRAVATGTIVDNDRAAALALTKTVASAVDPDGDGLASPGDTLGYTVTLRNSGSAPATSVVVEDPLPAELTLVAGSVTAAGGVVETETPLRVTADSLAVDATMTVRFQAVVRGDLAPSVSSVANQASARATGLAAISSDDPGTAAVGDPTVLAIAHRPHLEAIKTWSLATDADGDAAPSPGDTVAYTVTVTNERGQTATGVTFHDLVPANTTVVAGSLTSSRGSVLGSDPITVDIGSLAAGENAVVTFAVQIAATVPLGLTSVTNQGVVRAAGQPDLLTDDPARGGLADPTVTPLTTAPRLVLEKTDELLTDRDGDGRPSPGDVIGYRLRVPSVGNTAAASVIVRDAIPAHTTLVPGSVTTTGGTIASGSPVRVELGELAPLGSGQAAAEIRFAVEVEKPIAAGVRELTNQATVEATGITEMPSDDPRLGGHADPTVTPITAAPRLTFEKTALLTADLDGDGSASPGDELTYRLQLRNDGNTAATQVVITDQVPSHTTLVDGSPATSQGSIGTLAPLEVSVGTLAADVDVLVTFRVTIDAALPTAVLTISNQATVDAAELPPASSDDPATTTPRDATVTPVTIPTELRVADATVAEGDAGDVAASFNLELARPTNHPVTATWHTEAGTASGATDFASSTGTTTFAVGTVSAVVTAQVHGDVNDELDESFRLVIDQVVGAAVADGEALGVILDDDAPPALTVSPASTEEGDSGNRLLTFTVQLSQASGLPIAANYRTVYGTAGADDVSATSGTLQILAGATTATVGVQVVGDLLDENDETFTLELVSATNATLATAVATGTILDDDQAPTLSVANASVTEGNSGTTAATFAVSLSATSGLPVTVAYRTVSGTAGESDFTASTGTLEIPAGTTSATLDVQVVGDLLDENDETFTLELVSATNATLATAVATGTILDDDQAPMLSAANATVTEGDAGTTAATFSVSLSAASGQPVTVTYRTVSGTAGSSDFTASTGTLEIPAGTTSASIDVPVFGDLLDESDETFTLELVSATNAALATASVTGTILDDDAPPALSAADATVTEGNAGTTTTTFAVHLSAPSGKPVTATYRTVIGSAGAADFTAASGTVEIAVGATSATIDVAVFGDVLDEDDETFALELVSVTNATPAAVTATCTIRDDDAPPSLTLAGATVTEGNTGTTPASFALTLSATSGKTVSVTYRTVTGTAGASDFTAASGTVEIPAGATSAAIQVSVLGDLLDEPDETFLVELLSVSNATAAATSATGTIVDDDESAQLAVAVADVTVTEGSGADTVAQLTARVAQNASQPIEVDWQLEPGTATSGADFVAASGTATIATGAREVAIPASVVGDLNDEPNETLGLRLTAVRGGLIGDDFALVTILDDDAPPQLSVADVTVLEGDTDSTAARFTLHLDRTSGFPVTVTFATADGSAQVATGDYRAASGQATVPAGSLESPIVVDVLGDLADEDDETFRLDLTAPVNATLATTSATGVIVDDDEALLTIGDVRVVEGDSGTVTATFPIDLTSPVPHEVTVDWATVPETAKTPADYTSNQGSLVFPAQATHRQANVRVRGDLFLEADETFRVELSHAQGAGVGDPVGVGTIEDDERCAGVNLIRNGSAEDALVSGAIPSWTAVVGSAWQRRAAPPTPVEGTVSFYAGASALGELVQDVDVRQYAAAIFGGGQIFAFEGFVTTSNEPLPDVGRIVIEMRDASNLLVLDTFDSGDLTSTGTWRRVAFERALPPDTGFLRVRLRATRFSGTTADAFFDNLSLRTLRLAAITVDDVTLSESSDDEHEDDGVALSGSEHGDDDCDDDAAPASGDDDDDDECEGDGSTAAFAVHLTCAVSDPVTLLVATENQSATAGSDYSTVTGTLTFAPGETLKTVPVPILDDQANEPPETFLLRLQTAGPLGPMVELVDGVAVGTIVGGDWCPRSPGYWKNHASSWPVNELVLGGRTTSKATCLTYLNYGGSDAATKLARALVATKLNVASGYQNAELAAQIAAADAFLVQYPPGSNPRGAAKTQATTLKDQLEAHYTGEDCE